MRGPFALRRILAAPSAGRLPDLGGTGSLVGFTLLVTALAVGGLAPSLTP